MSAWSLRAKLIWWAVVAIGAATLVGSALRPSDVLPATGGEAILIAALGGACVLLALRPIELAPDWKLNAVAAPGVALSLLASPFLAGAVAALASIVADVWLQRRWYVVVFGGAERALAIGLAAAVAGALHRGPWPISDVAPIAAAGTIFLANSACISAISSARRATAFLSTWRTVCRSEGLAEIGLLCAGALAAQLSRLAPASLPLVVPPLVLAWRVCSDGARLRSLNERLAQSAAAQRRFVADAAHELRTPLASARAQLDVLRRTLGTQVGGTAERTAGVTALIGGLDGVDAELERMSCLLADLLTLARTDDGVPLTRVPVDIERVLVAVYREMRPIAGSVRLQLDICDDVDTPTVLGDEERLRQLFVNLVANALRFTPAGGVVMLRCGREGATVAIAVADNGIGIEPAALGKIFDRFYSGDPGRARGGAIPGGAGLGLSIARWIAEAHAGTIAVESTMGQGSTFTVRLPLAPAAALAVTAPPTVRIRASEPDAAGQPLRLRQNRPPNPAARGQPYKLQIGAHERDL